VLLGALMTGAAPVLAYYLKGRVELETKQKAQEQATVAVREAAAKVAPKLDEMITGFATRLETWIETASKEVHQEMIDVLLSAKRELAAATPDAERATQGCAALKEELATIRERLDEARATLWAEVDNPVPAG
jgi:hypothetical protein